MSHRTKAALVPCESPYACQYTRALQTVLEQGGSFAGINRKVQIKPLKWSQPEEGSKEEPRVVEALLILKHGGVLTHAGRQQVIVLHAVPDSSQEQWDAEPIMHTGTVCRNALLILQRW